MMSTARASRPSKDKSAKSSQAQNAKSDGQSVNMKNQATPEQLRMAQLTDKNDEVIEIQIKQVTELTGRDKDDALLALHDCDYDLNRAVERLLENEADLGEWKDAPTKKKRSQPANKQHATDGALSNHKNTEKRDRSHDRETDRERDKENAPRGRRDRGPPRFNRGRGRENQEEGRNDSRSRDRGFGERGRGRGRGGSRGRGSGVGGRGGSSGRGGFNKGGGSSGGGGGGFKERNPADQGPQIDTWTNETANKPEKENSIGAWGDMMETDWQVEADEWTGPLDNTKIFTASSNTSDGKGFPAMNDNDAAMFTQPPLETQVFTASPMPNTGNSVSPLNDSGASYQQNPIGQGPLTQNSFGQRLDLDILLPPKSSDGSSVNSQQQSSFMTQFAKQAEESIKNAVGITSSSSMNNQHMGGNNGMTNQSMGGPPGMGSQQMGGPPGMSNPATSRSSFVGGPAQSQPGSQRSKPQRTKLPPPSKIPASAVEMPGSMNFNVDVQFGNWADSDFSFGSSQPDPNNTTSLANVVASSSPGVINNHLPSQVTQSTSPSDTDPAIMASSVVSTATEPTMDNLASMRQTSSQSPRPNVFQNSTSATPPKDYNQTSLSQQTKISSSLEPIPYPNSQSDRKTTPYGSQRSNSGSMSSNNPVSSSAMSFSQPGYSTNSYQSSAYKTAPQPLTTTSYSGGHSNSSLQSGQYGTGSSYQNSSFQNQSGFSNENQSSSLYPNATNQTSSFQNAAGSGGGSSYQNQPSNNSYQSQSTYHRDTQSAGSAYPPSNNQSAGYQAGGPQSSSAYQTTVSQSSGSSYQRDGPSGQSNYSQSYGSTGHQNNLQTSPLSTSKLTDSLNKMSVKDSALDAASNQYDQSSNTVAALSLTSTTTTTSSSLASGSMSVPSALGLGAVSGTASAASSSSSVPSKPVTSKAPPNLPPGVPPIITPNYMMGQPGFPLAAFGLTQPQIYTYEDLQLQLQQQQQRLLPGYYDMQFQPPTTMTGRDQSTAAALAGTVPYAGATDANKLSRMEAQSPVTAQSSQPPQPSAQSAAAAHQQTFINAATLPPAAYANYYYAAGGVLPGPGGYSYQPTMFPVSSVTNAAHAGTTGTAQFQKPGAYGSHAYGAGYADTAAAAGAQDFNKTYGGVSQAQVKGSAAGTGVVTTASDLTAAAYGKTHSQSYEKPGFHGGTPPPFNLLPTGTQAGPMGATPTAYGAPYVPVMAHQPHSQMLHHHLQQDSNSGSSRGTGPSASQPKAAATKSYSTAYWGSN